MRLSNEIVQVGSASLLGISVLVTDPPVFILAGQKGFLPCAYFDVAVAIVSDMPWR